ncbi:MAG: excinuclease ABC subunit UvrA, partial [Candidatus Kariarchaeaceae archaeon]
MRQSISVSGARANNLQNIDIEIPRDKLTVITGVSGSGKTSLAFDVIFAEGQRKFLESMSSSARRRISIVDKADVDSVKGLSPVIAIQQSRGLSNPRSTVGTMTEISNYLRLLYATVGQAHCPYCNEEIPTKKKDQIAERILALPENTRVELRVPVFKIFRENYEYLFDEIRERGYLHVFINDIRYSLSDEILIDEQKTYRIEVLIDTFVIKNEIDKNVLTSIENANRVGHGPIQLILTDRDKLNSTTIREFYKDFTCSEHYIVQHEFLGYDFSFNHPSSACETCRGLGLYLKAERQLMIKNPRKGLRYCFTSGAEQVLKLYGTSIAKHYNFDLKTPFTKLPGNVKDVIFDGTKGEKIELIRPYANAPNYIMKRFSHSENYVVFDGLINTVDRWFRQSMKEGRKISHGYQYLKRFMREIVCQDCHGGKLRKQKLLITLDDKNIFEFGKIPLSEVNNFLKDIILPDGTDGIISAQIIQEITSRVKLLNDIGLGYININRRATTLSGGEEQRIKLSTQISSELMGMLYVLDEPTIGLHQKDNIRLISTLKKLKEVGNTVIVIEHDLEMINHAEHIIEMGPGPGIHGGS